MPVRAHGRLCHRLECEVQLVLVQHSSPLIDELGRVVQRLMGVVGVLDVDLQGQTQW